MDLPDLSYVLQQMRNVFKKQYLVQSKKKKIDREWVQLISVRAFQFNFIYYNFDNGYQI